MQEIAENGNANQVMESFDFQPTSGRKIRATSDFGENIAYRTDVTEGNRTRAYIRIPGSVMEQLGWKPKTKAEVFKSPVSDRVIRIMPNDLGYTLSINSNADKREYPTCIMSPTTPDENVFPKQEATTIIKHYEVKDNGLNLFFVDKPFDQ